MKKNELEVLVEQLRKELAAERLDKTLAIVSALDTLLTIKEIIEQPLPDDADLEYILHRCNRSIKSLQS
jgi:hypothetical protein